MESLKEIRRRGFEALYRELRLIGFIRFIQKYGLGHGDYTKERNYLNIRTLKKF